VRDLTARHGKIGDADFRARETEKLKIDDQPSAME
jgi:hypothetical protein